MSMFGTEPDDAGPDDEYPAGVNADGELIDDAADHEAQLQQLRSDVDGLADLVGDMHATRQGESGQPDPWCWRYLKESDRRKLWHELRTWVDWYNGRYGVAEKSRIPGCWFKHPPVVEELTALWVAWRYAYVGQGEPNDSPAYWHERLLWPTLERITSQPWGMKNCRGGHKEPVNVPLGASTDDDFDEFTGLTGSTVADDTDETGASAQ